MRRWVGLLSALGQPDGTDAIVVRRLPLVLPRLDPAFDGLRMAHLSDLHTGTWLTPARLADVVARVNAERPDLVVITGDIVSNRIPCDPARLRDALGGLRAELGLFAVAGNHDHRHPMGFALLRDALIEAGITVLENTVHTLHRGGAELHVAGLDDVIRRRTRLDRVLARLPADGAALLLVHEPDFADVSAATGRFDLQLSGHTHGGQIRLPLIGSPLLPKHGLRYPAGFYRVAGMYLYTNRGLGTGWIRTRFRCPPEFALLTLHAR